jgi:hypothetical protein
MGSFSIWHWLIVFLLFAPPLLFIPIIKKAGFSGWWVIPAMLPIVNIVLLWVFAFARWPSDTGEFVNAAETKSSPVVKATVIQSDKQSQHISVSAAETVNLDNEPPSASIKESTQPTDAVWEHVLKEFDGTERRAGLWARLFAESHGNEASAKANYLKIRAHDIQAEADLIQIQATEKQREIEQAKALSIAREIERAEELLPKGLCPNCEAKISVEVLSCPKCFARFDATAGWKIKPL